MKHLQIEIARSDLASIPMTLQSHQTAYDITSNALYLFSNSIYKWDITSNTWTTLSTTTTPTIQDNAVTIQDVVYFIGIEIITHNTSHILMVGGQTDSNTYIDQLQIYDVFSDLWSTETINISPIQGEGWACGYCHGVGFDLYVFGGEITGPEPVYLDNIFKYNPNDKWTSIGDLPDVQGYGWAVYREASG
eukprot:413471_1